MKRFQTPFFAARLFVLAAIVLGFSIAPVIAATVYDVHKPNLIRRHCANTSGEDAVNCLNDVMQAIKQTQSNIAEFKTVLAAVRGPLTASAKQFKNCQHVELNNRHQTSQPSAVKAGPACASAWNGFSGAVGALLNEACWVKASFRNAEKIEALRKKAESAEWKYDSCFAGELATTHSKFSDLWNVSDGDGFYSTYKKAVFEYKKYDLDRQLKAAFAACKASMKTIAKEHPARAEKLKSFGRCQ